MEKHHVFEVVSGKSFITGEQVLRQHKSGVFQASPLETHLPGPLCHCRARGLQGGGRASCAPEEGDEVEECLEVLGEELCPKVLRLCVRGLPGGGEV